MVLANRARCPDELVGGAPLVVEGACGGVYIGDLAVLVLGELCRRPDELETRLDRADSAYAAEGLVAKAEKGGGGSLFTPEQQWAMGLTSPGTKPKDRAAGQSWSRGAQR